MAGREHSFQPDSRPTSGREPAHRTRRSGRHAILLAALLLTLGPAVTVARSEAAGGTRLEFGTFTRQHETGTSYLATERTAFLVGGVGLWTGSLPFGLTWSVGTGLDIPVNAWSIVPRIDLDGTGDAQANGWMARATLNGRIATEFSGHVSYIEGGFGVERYEVTHDDDLGTSVRSDAFSPCFQFTTGTMSDPSYRPSLLLEGTVALPTRVDAPSAFLGRVGIRF